MGTLDQMVGVARGFVGKLLRLVDSRRGTLSLELPRFSGQLKTVGIRTEVRDSP